MFGKRLVCIFLKVCRDSMKPSFLHTLGNIVCSAKIEILLCFWEMTCVFTFLQKGTNVCSNIKAGLCNRFLCSEIHEELELVKC